MSRLRQQTALVDYSEFQTQQEVREIQNGEVELISILGADKLKSIGEQIAEIVRQHGLQKSPDTCRKLFTYLPDVIDGWNCV